jgi:hypothetical protein
MALVNHQDDLKIICKQFWLCGSGRKTNMRLASFTFTFTLTCVNLRSSRVSWAYEAGAHDKHDPRHVLCPVPCAQCDHKSAITTFIGGRLAAPWCRRAPGEHVLDRARATRTMCRRGCHYRRHVPHRRPTLTRTCSIIEGDVCTCEGPV